MARNSSPHKHMTDALESIVKAQQGLQSTVDRHEKVIASQGRDIAALEVKVRDLRDASIVSDLDAGLSGREVAAKYSLSEGRVSQIRSGAKTPSN